MAKIHPAEAATAFWYLQSALCNLLCWAEHPDPNPLDSNWLEEFKSDFTGKADSALRSVEQLADDTLSEDIKRAKRLGVSFATLLCDNPSLSTIRIQDWKVPRFQEMFNELAQLETEFERLAMRHAEITDQSGRKIIRGMVERDDESGLIETVTDLPSHWKPVIRWMQKQFSTDHPRFPESQLKAIFPEVAGIDSCLEYLESIGAVKPKRHGAFAIELGRDLSVIPDVPDRRDICPQILTLTTKPAGDTSNEPTGKAKTLHEGLGRRLRIVKNESPEMRAFEQAFEQEFEALTGIAYPPKNTAEWMTVLIKAHFDQTWIDKAMCTFGEPGFEDCGELPRPYVSTGGVTMGDAPATLEERQAKFGSPQFTPVLMMRLRQYATENAYDRNLKTPVEPQASGDATGGKTRLRPCDIKAESQYKLAKENSPNLDTDRAVYEWYVENLADENETLPAFETWATYLRRTRAASGNQRNKRGGGHETRSVVSGSKIEQQNRTKADQS